MIKKSQRWAAGGYDVPTSAFDRDAAMRVALVPDATGMMLVRRLQKSLQSRCPALSLSPARRVAEAVGWCVSHPTAYAAKDGLPAEFAVSAEKLRLSLCWKQDLAYNARHQ
jgi:hypothetical protein